MAYRGTIIVAGLPAKSLHVYDEGLLLAKPRFLLFAAYVVVLTAVAIITAFQAKELAFIPLAALAGIIPAIWKRFVSRKPPASLPQAGHGSGQSVITFDEISSVNFEELNAGKRTLAVKTRQGNASKYTWWTQSAVASNLDDKTKQILTPFLAKPRSFY